MSEVCKTRKCTNDRYGEHDRCILHCDKSKFDANDISLFWEKIREEYVTYNGRWDISEEIIIEGVIFPYFKDNYRNKRFFINYNHFSHNVKFIKCVFTDDCDLFPGNSLKKMTFDNCTFYGDIKLIIANDIEIVNSEFKNKISLGNPDWKKVHINNTKFIKDVNLTVKENLNISDASIFRGNLNIDGIDSLVVHCEKSLFDKHFLVQNTKHVNIDSIELKSNVFFNAQNTMINVKDINFKKDVSFESFSNLSITDSKFDKKINFNAEHYSNIKFDNAKLNDITFQDVSNLKIINDSEIHGNLELKGNYQLLNIVDSRVYKKLDVHDVTKIVLKASQIDDYSHLNGHYNDVLVSECSFKDLSIKTVHTLKISDVNVEGNLDLLGEQYELITIEKTSISDKVQIGKVTKLELSNIKSNPSVKLVHDIYDDINITDVRFHDLEINAVKSLIIQKSIIRGKLNLLGKSNGSINLETVTLKDRCDFPDIDTLNITNKSKFYKGVNFNRINNLLAIDSKFKNNVDFLAEYKKIKICSCDISQLFKLCHSCDDLEIEDCRFHEEVNFNESEFEKIKIVSSIFEGKLLFISSTIRSMIFSYTEFSDAEKAENSMFLERVDFTSSFIDELKIFDSAFLNELNFINMKNEIDLSNISNTTIEKLDITDSSVIDLFNKSNDLNITELVIENSKLNSSIEEIDISEIVIDDFKCNKLILLKNMNFTKMTIDKFRIGNSNIEDRFRIKESDIGTFHLISSTFEDLQIIDNKSEIQDRVKELRLRNTTIKNAVLDKLEYNSFIMSTAHVSEAKIGYVKFDEGSRETNRFFKNYYDSISDYIKANIYYQQEMQEHYKTTSDKLEKFVLFLGKWISDFGQSWVRPLLWIIALTLIVLSSIHFDKFSTEYIINHKLYIWNGFWEFLNPFSKSVQVKYKDVYGVWMIHKLLMTVFIYHFVVAIKRKTKR